MIKRSFIREFYYLYGSNILLIKIALLSSYTSISFIRSFSDTVSFPPQAVVPATIKTIQKNIAYFLYSKSTQQYIISCQDHYKHHNNRDCLLHQLPPGYPEIFRNDRKADVRRRNLHCRIRKCHQVHQKSGSCMRYACKCQRNQ